MSSNNETARFWDDRAEAFDSIYSGRKGFLPRLWDRLTRRNIFYRLRFSVDSLSPLDGKRILDVGCGTGRYCVEIVSRGAAEVTGLDLSVGMLERAERLARRRNVSPRCRFVRCDAREFRSDTPFDGVIAMGFFDYIQDPARIMSALAALVSGRLIASFPARRAFRAPFRKVWLLMHGCPVFFYSKREIISLCEQSGLSCRSITRRGPIYLLVAEPPGGDPSAPDISRDTRAPDSAAPAHSSGSSCRR